jgi:hypothetical protein
VLRKGHQDVHGLAAARERRVADKLPEGFEDRLASEGGQRLAHDAPESRVGRPHQRAQGRVLGDVVDGGEQPSECGSQLKIGRPERSHERREQGPVRSALDQEREGETAKVVELL